ncbi:GGDEF domain-containing protein [Mycoplasmopsis cricetuli]|uniref:DHH family phosphoesterase n=1 Tax=Mycoplasmopsis cricetuli TaxID=171283 RepID=UPI000472AD51|nr:DHH family phosphoesterase [Mycoplasmopsis cricetuli]
MRNKNKIILSIISLVAFLIFFILLLLPILIKQNNTFILAALIFGIISVLVIEFLILYFILIRFIKSRELIEKSFNVFVEDIMSNNNIGIIIYDTVQEIAWSSSFIKNKFKSNFIGWKIEDFFKIFEKKLNKSFNLNQTKIEFKDDDNFYEAQFWSSSNAIVIRDISTEYLFKNEAQEQKSVIGEVEIDNFQLYQSILSEEEIFRINKIVIDIIDEYVKKYNIIYRQYTNGKFIILTNEQTLEKLKQEKFEHFFNINDKGAIGINKISLSIGFASGWSSLQTQLEQAKKALLQSHSRGGDQVVVFSNIEKPIYFGSYSEIIPDNSRTKIKQITLQIKDKLQNKDIERVIIYGHSIADLDSIGASYGLYEIAKSFGKEAYIGGVTFDSTALTMMYDIKKQVEEAYSIKNMQTLSKLTNNKTMVIFVDNSDVSRTDNPNALINTDRNNVFVLDHHRVAKSIDYCPRINAYIDTIASSASEIVTEVISFMDGEIKISELAAQLLLNGIYLDTNQFSKSVSQKTFVAAGYLESKGAKSSEATEILKIDEKTQKKVEKLLENLIEIKPGYFLSYSNIVASNDTISIAANEVLKIKGRIASFVVARLQSKKENIYKLSARGINTNVQIICESVGGGGHFGVAAAVSNEDLDTFVDNIKHAIIMTGDRDESNFN